VLAGAVDAAARVRRSRARRCWSRGGLGGVQHASRKPADYQWNWSRIVAGAVDAAARVRRSRARRCWSRGGLGGVQHASI